MSAWIQKIDKFKALLDVKVSDHKSSVEKVRSNIDSLAQTASTVQPRMLFELALCEPQLIHVPRDNARLKFTTVYDIIQHNLIEILITEGNAHLDTLNE